MSLTAGGGADCRLDDYRLTANLAGDIVLVYAVREFGETFADEQWVSFHLYKLTQGGDEDGPGPDWYFQEYKAVKSHKKYCDVNDAMKAEVKPATLQMLELKKTK